MTMTINGQTLAALGLTTREHPGWLDAPAQTRTYTGIPNLLGVTAANYSTTPVREMRLLANLKLANLTDRAAALAKLQDALAGLLTLRFDDTPGRIVRAIAGQVTSASWAPQLAMTAGGASLIVSVPFVSIDTASYDDNPRVIAIQTTSTEIELGTLPSPGLVQWSGSWTSATTRTLVYRGHNGIAYGTMTLTAQATLGSDEYIEIDLGRQYITKVSNVGVRSDAANWLTAGDWFVPESSDYYRPGSRWATLEVSAGVCIFLYRKAWKL